MSKISYIYTKDNLSAFIAGRAFVIHNSNPKFAEILEALKKDTASDILYNLFDEAESLVKYCHKATSAHGVVKYENGLVYIHGEVASGPIVEKIKQFKQEGLDPQPLLNYFERLQRNSSHRAVQELYTFLERENLPITPDGNILAYKAITKDWYDKHTQKISNALGTVVSMPRNQVADDCNQGCSAGLHAGSLGYVKGFASGYGQPDGDRIIIVEIDPADVVSIPTDANFSKMRVCKYKVLASYEGPLPETYVPNPNKPYAKATDDDHWDDEDGDEDSEE